MRETIVITGMGAVTPIGTGVEQYWDNLIRGRSGVGPITRFDPKDLAVQIAAEVRDFPAEQLLPKALLRQTDAFTQFAYAAAEEALGPTLPAPPERMGIVMGTAMAGIATTADTQEALTRAVHKNVGPRFVPKILGNIAASQIAISRGICGPSLTISTACASGSDAVGAGAAMLLSGSAEAVLVVGAESILCPLVIYSLSNAHALSRCNGDPAGACRPFDRDRSGFVIGEGGGALVLETLSHARARGAVIYGELAGWANNNDAYHVTDPEPSGSRAAACMESALAAAGLRAQDVGYVNAHGTGTEAGDRAEAAAIGQVFSGAGVKISSTKGATGHMMGAGGITEAIACLKALETGILPPTMNLTAPAFDLDFVGPQAQRQPIGAAMSNSFGFGGQNSCLVFRRFER
ncbi:MAG: beta-ketoacyl-[Oscillospiraceae bacterium]|nr:beta-ketoacyl-[acyl-carrier-protein] synthase family protein [Oscillospiraceae bacterium]